MVQGFSSSSNSTNPHSEFVQEGQQGTCLCIFQMVDYNSSRKNFCQTILLCKNCVKSKTVLVLNFAALRLRIILYRCI